MDRFDSREDAPEWSERHFVAGRAARLTGKARDAAPSGELVSEFGRRSWLAGWTDTDMGLLADAETEQFNAADRGCGRVFDLLAKLPLNMSLVRDGADPFPQDRSPLE